MENMNVDSESIIKDSTIDPVLKRRFDTVLATLGDQLTADERSEITARIASDYVLGPSNADALANSLNRMPFWSRLRWHAEGALVNFGIFAAAGAGVAYTSHKFSKRIESTELVGTEANPFESTGSVEASPRKRRDHGHAEHATH